MDRLDLAGVLRALGLGRTPSPRVVGVDCLRHRKHDLPCPNPARRGTSCSKAGSQCRGSRATRRLPGTGPHPADPAPNRYQLRAASSYRPNHTEITAAGRRAREGAGQTDRGRCRAGARDRNAHRVGSGTGLVGTAQDLSGVDRGGPPAVGNSPLTL